MPLLSARQSGLALLSQNQPDASNAALPPLELDDAAILGAITENIRDQDDLERVIALEADHLLSEQALEREERRLKKAKADLEKLVLEKEKITKRSASSRQGARSRATITVELERIDDRILSAEADIKSIEKRIDDRHKPESQHGTKESRREFLIRTGKITPFSKLGEEKRNIENIQDALVQAEEDKEIEEQEKIAKILSSEQPLSHQNLLLPGFADEREPSSPSIESAASDFVPSPESRPRKRRKASDSPNDEEAFSINGASLADPPIGPLTESVLPTEHTTREASKTPKQKRKFRALSVSFKETTEPSTEDLSAVDDGNENAYQARLQKWVKERGSARKRAETKMHDNQTNTTESQVLQQESAPLHQQEWLNAHPTKADGILSEGFKIPGDIFPSLFDYQKTGVRWLWELYSQQVGGIVGDEMGLGKTIQAIAFIAGLHYSGNLTKPVIIVTPATVLKQWVNEFHRWWPPLRVSILHASGSGMLNLNDEESIENELENLSQQAKKLRQSKGRKSAHKIVERVVKSGHVLVTTYAGLQSYGELLIPIDWQYCVLDEGHKIRNPNANITIFCKELKTPNRIILSGTPMQNNLTELWSLFDFIYPMRLGTLITFRIQFEIPIKQGGYANANNLQIETATKCAEALKDTISPYLLQRRKVDVAADLPKKSEQVLFCKLTKAQRDIYEDFLNSNEMKRIQSGNMNALKGIDMLKKICNHPDLPDKEILKKKAGYDYGNGEKAGKMHVVKVLLESWKTLGHKTLLFTQGTAILDILERLIKDLGGFQYRRMDGSTPIKDRQSIVDEFNKDPEIHVFLLTTRVGGLGVNLTGANRVIIYDPDWNPSTDIQARERAWRLGQKKEVTIYRLMTAGTIEEKIYHRQIFKQFLTEKVLRDPGNRQTFSLRDLHDLFTLGEEGQDATETGKMFKGTEVRRSSDEKPSIPGRDSPVSELNEVDGVARAVNWEGGEAETQANNEARIMEGLFARSGIYSVHEHDEIINGKRKITADPEIISKEAKKIAAKSAQSLVEAGKIAKTIPIGTVTWTGEAGVTGKPEVASLSNSNKARKKLRLKGLIKGYFLAHEGVVYSQMILNHFQHMCETADDGEIFYEALNELATLEKGSSSQPGASSTSPPSSSTNSGSGSATITSSPSTTASNSPSNSNTSGQQSASASQTSSNQTQTTEYDPQLPAGGVQLVTPGPFAGPQYYKIKDNVSFVWNYTSLLAAPSAVDIVAKCQENNQVYTIATNQSVGDTGSVIWDTGAYQASATVPLLTGTYTLVIYDSAKGISATASPGYLGTFNQFTFGMYTPQPYTPLTDYKCATCSSALSDIDRHALKFVFGMCIVTVLSFTWFTGTSLF
ncbi:MAG: hypothetical protein M1829_005884 [Trizodia sp. TS-e1964]|nr:MAG: hypothetical protein M1829_005884 [Trizodia sp. TS-e1964]